MKRKYHLLNFALLLWFLALLAWCTGAPALARHAGSLAVVTFLVHILFGWIVPMFKKQKSLPLAAESETPSAHDHTHTAAEVAGGTVIASDVFVEGNIETSSPICVYGRLNGNITAPESVITVMHHGRVEGNIQCRELVIDGTVIGQCHSDIVEICENGKVQGTLAYRHLAVKQGGQFSGQADTLTPVQEMNNVMGLIIDASPEPEEDAGR